MREHDNFYLNAAEVSEVVKRVSELADDWPDVWGPKDLKQIAVFSAYRIQVIVIKVTMMVVTSMTTRDESYDIDDQDNDDDDGDDNEED